MKKWIPWIFVAVFAGWVLSNLRQPAQKDFDVQGFASLPALLNGRIQPLDSVARNTLLQIRNKQSVFLADENDPGGMFPKGTKISAIQWLMDTMMKPESTMDMKIFRVDNPELLGLLKFSDKDKYFSFNQLKPSYDEVASQAQRLITDKIQVSSQTPFEKQVSKLANAMFVYQQLGVTLRPTDSISMTKELEQAVKDMDVVRPILKSGKEAEKETMERLDGMFMAYSSMSRFSYARMIPPDKSDKSRDNWISVGTSVTNSIAHSEIDPAVKYYAEMVDAYRANKPTEFNKAVSDYQKWLGEWFKPEEKKANAELFFNHFEPFYLSMIIYVTAFLLACFFWFNWSEWLRASAFNLIVLAWCIHTFGLVFRMVLEGRPPVTNLYSSAIFIGWGAAVLGMVLEKLYRDGVGAVIAAVAGFTTLVIAHNLALGGDTMEMMRAVLDSNFWLSTHVTVVTLGYASTFVAGFLAIIYVVRGLFTKSLSEATAKALTRMVYGIVCFAALFSFVGTVLGGIWADQSWGRFWGWDPKENGALMIVIWNATILHARWGGLIRERGLMNMAIFGNIITSFSWFGVNMLGIGLHSYGFMDSAFKWLIFFVGSQVALIGMGMLPLHYWMSFREKAAAVAKAQKPEQAGRPGKASEVPA